MNDHPRVDRHPRPAGQRGPLLALLLAALLIGLTPLLGLAAPLPAGQAEAAVRDALVPTAVTTLDGAGPDRDLGAVNPRDYMTVSLTTARPALVRVHFTGYAFAKSSAAGVLTPGCPCLVRGELRVNQEAKQIVTRTVLATRPGDIVADPAANPPVAAADRRDLSGSHVFSVPAGTHTFTMSLLREVGTAQNVGFAFGRMQAEAIANPALTAVTTLDGAGADRDLAGTNPKDYMTVSVTLPQPAQVRVNFTGYAFAKSSAVGVQTPGCPCLVRAELRANQEARQTVSRTVLATTGSAIVGDPGANPPVAAAERRNLAGSHLFNLPAGAHTFTMSLVREVGAAENIGFAFGRMQAEVELAIPQAASVVLDGAGADRDLAGANPKDYMTVAVRLDRPSLVRVRFTGYAFAKSSAVGTQTPGCPCLVRGELRANQEPGQIVTRTVLATDAGDAVGNPGATPPVAVADRRNLAGAHVFALPAGDHTITMSLRREVGTAENIGFAFGRMQADVSPMMPTTMPRTGLGAAEPTALAPWLLGGGLVLLVLAGWRRWRDRRYQPHAGH